MAMLGRRRRLPLLLLVFLEWVLLARAQPWLPGGSPGAAQPQSEPRNIEFTCSQHEEELGLLFRENLEPDFAPWRNMSLSMSDLEHIINKWPPADTRRTAMIYKNKLYFPLQANVSTCEMPCNTYLLNVEQAFATWSKTIQFPDCVFLLSVWDHYHCDHVDKSKILEERHCSAPVLSIAKLVDHPTQGTAYDILIPKAPTKKEAVMLEFPWQQKIHKAVWRGTRWCDWGRAPPAVNCSRFYMADLTQQPNVSALFDYGFVAADKGVPLVPHMQSAQFAKYKFLLNLDGFTAAYRLSKLMLMNSVVLKEESHLNEYFYRALKPYQHYIPIFKANLTDLTYSKTDVIDVLRQYQDPKKEHELKRIARDAQMFVARYACPSARMLYWRKVLVEFKKLFPDMDQAIKDKWLPLLEKSLGKQL